MHAYYSEKLDHPSPNKHKYRSMQICCSSISRWNYLGTVANIKNAKTSALHWDFLKLFRYLLPETLLLAEYVTKTERSNHGKTIIYGTAHTIKDNSLETIDRIKVEYNSWSSENVASSFWKLGKDATKVIKVCENGSQVPMDFELAHLRISVSCSCINIMKITFTQSY